MIKAKALVISLLLVSASPAFAENKELPCLEASDDCVDLLAEQVMDNSLELSILGERLDLTDEQIDYNSRSRWTNYLTLDPLRLISNLFGGGEVRRDRLRITELEIRSSELIRRQAQIKDQIRSEIREILLGYEERDRRLSFLRRRLRSQEVVLQLQQIDYQYGGVNTSQMVSAWDRHDSLSQQISEIEQHQTQTKDNLLLLIGQ